MVELIGGSVALGIMYGIVFLACRQGSTIQRWVIEDYIEITARATAAQAVRDSKNPAAGTDDQAPHAPGGPGSSGDALRDAQEPREATVPVSAAVSAFPIGGEHRAAG